MTLVPPSSITRLTLAVERVEPASRMETPAALVWNVTAHARSLCVPPAIDCESPDEHSAKRHKAQPNKCRGRTRNTRSTPGRDIDLYRCSRAIDVAGSRKANSVSTRRQSLEREYNLHGPLQALEAWYRRRLNQLKQVAIIDRLDTYGAKHVPFCSCSQSDPQAEDLSNAGIGIN